MKYKKKASFYEGLFIIQCFWTLIAVCLLVTFTVYAILYNEFWDVPFIILLGYIFIMAFSYFLGKTCLRKVTIDENGITLNRKKTTSFYNWSEICSTDIKIIKFKDTIFTFDFFLWLFRISYLEIAPTNSEMIILTIVIQNKYKKIIYQINK